MAVRQLSSDAFVEAWVGGYALDAARCGTASTNVLRWLAANVTTQCPEGWMVAADSATLGTTVTIRRRGKYIAYMNLIVNAHADSTLTSGISKNGTVLAADIAYNAAFANGFLPGSKCTLTNPAAAGLTAPMVSVAYFDVNDAEAGAGCICRFHCYDVGTGSPTANAITAAGDHGFCVAYVDEKIS